jgi:hypothetical protein
LGYSEYNLPEVRFKFGYYCLKLVIRKSSTNSTKRDKSAKKKKKTINRTMHRYCWNPEIQTYEIMCLLTENGAKALTMENRKNER